MTTTIQLKPVAGFCVKSTVVQQGLLAATLDDAQPLPVPFGHKVFVNIAWDPNVPDDRTFLDEPNPDAWYVPVVVSNARQVNDKAGKPSLVFDCVYNTAVRSRSLTDPQFKLFIVELALQRIEAQTSLVLSRQIGTPNIASKGNLLPRTVSIPSSLLTGGPIHPAPPAPSTTQHLIQEWSPTMTPSSIDPKGILKPTSTSTLKEPSSSPPLTWSWSKDGTKIQIQISVPNLPRARIEQATFDIEPRRFILHVPDYPVLDVNLDLSDAELVATAASWTSASLHDENGTELNNALTLKRQRPLDVDGATSEWRVAENMLVIVA